MTPDSIRFFVVAQVALRIGGLRFFFRFGVPVMTPDSIGVVSVAQVALRIGGLGFFYLAVFIKLVAVV